MPGNRKDSFVRTELKNYIVRVRATLADKIAENEQRKIAIDAFKARYPQGSRIPPEEECPTQINGVDGICSLLDQLEELTALDLQLFGEDGSREPSPRELYDFGQKCSDCLSSMELVSKYSTNTAIDDEMVLSVSLDLSLNVADEISAELKPYAKTRKPGPVSDLTPEEKEEAEELIADSVAFISSKIDERVRNLAQKQRLRKNIWKEFPHDVALNEFKGKIDDPLQLTGSTQELAQYYVKNKKTLSEDESNYLLGRIGSMEYIRQLSEASRTEPPAPVFSVLFSEDKNSFKLDGYQGKYQYQTTGCGCWSCAYAMLLEAYGKGLNQQILRAARPNAGSADLNGVKEESIKGIVHDAFFSPFETADLCSKLVPNAAMRQVGIENMDPGHYADAREQFEKYVTEAIYDHHSPVALTNGTHFYTIVGINKKNHTMTVLNSLGEKKGLEQIESIDDYLWEHPTVTLTYLQSLEFSKDGRCTNIPGHFGHINYKNGNLLNMGDKSDSLNMDGAAFSNSQFYGQATLVNDSIYLPDSVPEIYFGRQLSKAENREITPEDEELAQALELSRKMAERSEKIADIRLALSQEIENTHTQLGMIAESMEHALLHPDDPNNLTDPYEALRYTAAALIARTTLLDVFDRSKDPEMQLGMERLITDSSVVNDVARSKSFHDFYDAMGNAQIARLLSGEPNSREAARKEFHDKFVHFMAEPQVVKDESKKPLSAEKDAPTAALDEKQKDGRTAADQKEAVLPSDKMNKGPVFRK